MGYDGTGGGENTSNFPTWQPEDGGRFFFDGGHGLNIANDMGTHSEGTHEVWLYKDTTGGTDYIGDARNGSGSWWLTEPFQL